jgi:hypothetical protein
VSLSCASCRHDQTSLQFTLSSRKTKDAPIGTSSKGYEIFASRRLRRGSRLPIDTANAVAVAVIQLDFVVFLPIGRRGHRADLGILFAALGNLLEVARSLRFHDLTPGFLTAMRS